MLTSYAALTDSTDDVDTVHNYYEHLVLNEIHRQLGEKAVDTNFIADAACIALNHLPPRYVRYDVDMAFYLSPKESGEMEEKVTAAVSRAIVFVELSGNRTK
ncbi:MAG: hypothetical protein JWM78_538 [Verrucomicrobiaceae bacterium]|nr:hypothetical protein [Verrucomicrobiaceae bacterium]